MHKKSINFRDVIILLLIITSLAFYDIKPLFISIQIFAFLSEALRRLGKNNKTKIKAFFVWSTILVTYSLMSLLWASPYNTTSITTILSLIQVMIIAITIMFYCENENNCNKVINYIIISSIILSIRFFIEIPLSAWGNEERFSKETIFGSNIPAITLAYASLLLIYKKMSKINKNKKISKLSTLLLAILFLTITFLMGTKKSIIIFILGLIVIMIQKSKNLIIVIRNTFIISAIIIIGYISTQKIPVLYGSIGYRINDAISDIFEDKNSSVKSTAMRIKLIEDAARVFRENPLIGVGQDGYRYENTVGKSYSHCNFVELLANLGLIGFIIYYAIYIYIYNKSNKSKYKELIKTLLIVMFVSDISIVSYLMEYQYVLYGLIFGMLNARITEKTTTEPYTQKINFKKKG